MHYSPHQLAYFAHKLTLRLAGTTVTGATYTASANGPAGIRRGETSSGYQFGMRHNF